MTWSRQALGLVHHLGTGETRYEQDLPSCCRGAASRSGAATDAARYFECDVCGDTWQLPLPVEPEFDAFTYRVASETEGAA